MATSNSLSAYDFLMIQLAFMVLLFVSRSQNNENAFDWVTLVAKNLAYLLIARGLQEACAIIQYILSGKKPKVTKWREWLVPGLVLVTSAGVVVASGASLGYDFLPLYTAYLACQLVGKKPAPTINYGQGMACSFFEGYLSLIIPSDGAHTDNFVEKIRKLESKQGVVFPVKKLLLVVTKSLRCPPDLKEFNDPNRHDLPQIESCEGPEEVRRDMAGVKNRRYRNTAYKLHWPDASRPPVYVAAECATPLHTLYGVTQKHKLYQELCDVDIQQLVDDFCSQLEAVVERSPDCRGKCVLVHFDDTKGSGEYLPQVLLDTVASLEPRYEDIIARHAADLADRPDVYNIMRRTTMGELTNWAPPPDEETYFANIVAILDNVYPPVWRSWEVYDVSYEDLFGQSITSATESLLRFALPTVYLAYAFNSRIPERFSDKRYRSVKRTLINWPLGRALIYYPRSLMDRVHPDRESDNGFRKCVSLLKRNFISRHEASAILKREATSSGEESSSSSGYRSSVSDSARNTTGLERNTTRSERNASGSERNATGSDRNTAGSERNTTGLERNTTGSERNTTGSARNAIRLSQMLRYQRCIKQINGKSSLNSLGIGLLDDRLTPPVVEQSNSES